MFAYFIDFLSRTNLLDNGSLILEAVKTGDAGIYMCIGRHEGRQLNNLIVEADLVIASKYICDFKAEFDRDCCSIDCVHKSTRPFIWMYF